MYTLAEFKQMREKHRLEVAEQLEKVWVTSDFVLFTYLALSCKATRRVLHRTGGSACCYVN